MMIERCDDFSLAISSRTNCADSGSIAEVGSSSSKTGGS
jgi:hypothetical protein